MRKTKPDNKRNLEPPPDAQTVTAKVPAADLARIDAYGEHIKAERGLDPKRGPLLLALARKGLEVFEREVRA